SLLRTYQLLVSPSVLSYLIHDMVFNFKAAKQSNGHSFMNRVRNSFYIWSVKEFNLDSFLHRYLWSPFKWLGNAFSFFGSKLVIILLSLLFMFGVYANFYPSTI